MQLALLAAALVAPGAAGAAEAPELPARAWLLVDAGDGKRLAGAQATARRAVASTTKLMTAHLARRLPLRRRVEAAPYSPLPGESLMGLKAGDRVRVRNLLYGLLLPSGNDAAVTLAHAVSGSVPDFVDAMNRSARHLGLDDTHYANPIGLDSPAAYSTARDLGALAIRLRRDPVLANIFDTREVRVEGAHPQRVENHNHLLGEVPWVDGVKTGYTEKAGFVLVGSGTRHGVSLVSVVLGAPSLAARDEATLDLLRYGFSLYRPERALARREAVATVSVAGAGQLTVVAGRDARVLARRDQPVRVSAAIADGLEAPVARGERVGEAVVTVGGREAERVPLRAAHALVADERSLIERLDDGVPGSRALAWGAIGAAVAIVIGIAVALVRRRRG